MASNRDSAACIASRVSKNVTNRRRLPCTTIGAVPEGDHPNG